MNGWTEQWVRKAEQDYIGASLLLPRAIDLPDVICFHCQQVAEKYLKAYIAEQGQLPSRTHNLFDLMAVCLTYDPGFQSLEPELDSLNQYAVDFRYPNMDADDDDARDAHKAAVIVRDFVRAKLGI